MRRIGQIDDAHCGPAVIQMLLSNIGIAVTQPQIAAAGNAQERILEYGMRIDQMELAIKMLSPHAQFWYKEHSHIRDIQTILSRGYPVGVEWQGDFSDDEEEEERDDSDFNKDDPGHYSVITHIDEAKDELIIVDPYKNFSEQDRIFSINEFIERWWDTNEVFNPLTQTTSLVKDHHMIFIITFKDTLFPMELGMLRSE